MARVGQNFTPGTVAPESGVYRSTKSNQAVVVNKGRTLPPAPQAGEKWKLTQRTTH